jgi:hypothetical protein
VVFGLFTVEVEFVVQQGCVVRTFCICQYLENSSLQRGDSFECQGMSTDVTMSGLQGWRYGDRCPL